MIVSAPSARKVSCVTFLGVLVAGSVALALIVTISVIWWEKTGSSLATPVASPGHRLDINRLGAYVLMPVRAGRLRRRS